MFKSGRGGARQGAGRPKGAKTKNPMDSRFKRNRLGVRLPMWVIDWIRGQNESSGRLVEKALVHYFKLKKPD